jgi:hypothetical protein
MWCLASLLVLLASADFLADEHQATGSEQVMLNAGGSLQTAPSIVRRHHEDGEEHHHHGHHKGSVKAMFKALDLNGDGMVTGAELKARMKKGDFHSKTLNELMSKVQDSDEGYTTYSEFLKAVHLATDTALGHALLHTSKKHHSAVHEHSDQLLEQGDRADWVTCGGHKAPSCAVCPMTDSTGQTVFDHGIEWCHGDCVYAGSQCHPLGTITVSGTAQGSAVPYSSTTEIPDILNPNITANDASVINKAAEASIREENMEAAEKMRAEEEAREAKKFSWGKFWLIVTITFSVILGVCALVSIVAFCVFYFMATPGPAGKDEDDEGEALADADGEDAGALPEEKAVAAEEVAGESKDVF